MQVKEVDPYKVNVDEMNERTENLSLSDLEESIEQQGIIQPPIVRKRNGDAEVPYSVVVGQRRTLAAQGVGLDKMPVVVMDWDDGEAIEASITENVEAFREKVSRKDRAYAIERLKNLNNWNNKQVAQKLGVHSRVITDWLEYTRDEWEGTIVDPEIDKEEIENEEFLEISKQIEELSPDVVKKVRNMTGGGVQGEELLKKAVKHDLRGDDVREMAKKVKRGADMDSAVAQTIEEKHESGDIKVKANVTFSGDHAGALTSLAKERGMTENEVVREAITDYLEREGYL